jgi:hypothetical protein
VPDSVTHWNSVLLKVVRDVGGAPGPIARGGAMMHGAIHDAVNSIAPTHEPCIRTIDANPDASIDAAVAHAAHDALAAAFPDTRIDLIAERTNALAGLPGTAAQLAAGKAAGKAAALAMVAERENDGADAVAPYVAGNRPGDWRPTSSGPAAGPHWPEVRPFAMEYGSQFRPPRPGGFESKAEMLRSPEYAAQYNEVKNLGAKNSPRTTDQTNIALFWANDLDGTYKPPGQLFEITRIVSEQRGLSVLENARLFALVALAMADAAVVAWDAKYARNIDLWRPESAIRDAMLDPNPATQPDSGWVPLSQDRLGVPFSPPFPAYVSGHATFGAAHAGIMRRYFGTDNVTFTATTEDPHPLVQGHTRTFNSFTAAALENARSRVYLGVHFQWDGDHGFHSGNALAEYVYATKLRPLVPPPADDVTPVTPGVVVHG